MKTAVTAAALAGFAAAAQAQQVQATIAYQLSFTEVYAGTTIPANGNGILEPGEGAYLRLTVLLTPPVGTVVAVDPSVLPGGTATLRGIHSIFLDLIGTNFAQGTWTNLHIDENWELVSHWPGVAVQGGAKLQNIQAGQFPFTQSGVMTTNPIVNVFSGVWTPGSYTPRTVLWSTANGNANPSPFSSAVIVRDGENPQIYSGSAATAFGSASVPIVPTPAGLALLGAGLLLAASRRRKRNRSICSS